jgi:hypothetical protein
MWSFQGEFAFEFGKLPKRAHQRDDRDATVVESASQTERAFGFTPNPQPPLDEEEDKR